MAFPVWRRTNRKVYVYFNDPRSNKLTQLPRSETKHLDGLPEADVRAWVGAWEKSHGVLRDRAGRVNLKETDKLHSLWLQYQAHRDFTRGRRKGTSRTEDELFRRHIVSYFVGVCGTKLPSQWHRHVVGFHTYLAEKKLSISSIQAILWTLERFGAHLVWQGYLEYPFVVSIPSRSSPKVTPLKVRLAPQKVIEFVKSSPQYDNAGDIDFNLAILLGYFAALSPSELFALDKADLLTGDNAQKHAKTSEGFRRYGLGSKLSVVVNKTLPPKGKNSKPIPLVKNSYRYAVVHIWDPNAAKLIGAMVRDKPDGRLFPYSYGHLIRRWRENVRDKLGTTPHDLRRASCLYLGRVKRIELTLLQEHMRHSEIETTMLYTREPAIPENRPIMDQDFDDVA